MKHLLVILIVAALFIPCAAADSSPRAAEPAGEWWVTAGDVVTFTLVAPAGGSASFTVGGDGAAHPMAERGEGVYEGAMRITAAHAFTGEPVKFNYVDKSGLSSALSSKGTLTVMGEEKIAAVKEKDAILRTGPGDDWDRRYPLHGGARLVVTGMRNGWCRVALAEGLLAWVHRDCLSFLPTGSPPPQARLKSIRCRMTPRSVELDLAVTETPAFAVRECDDQRGLDIVLYHAVNGVDDILHPADMAYLRTVAVRQEGSSTSVIHLGLDGPPWGFTTGVSEGRVTLSLKRPPAPTLRGARIVLDPGHGGKDPGAVGAGGLEEKAINLKVALALRDLLAERGAEVVMTRETDTEVFPGGTGKSSELGARVERAAAAGGDLFISLHHNALGNVDEGRRAHGTSTYFYWSQSGDLARSLLLPLAEALGEERACFLRRSFHVIRQTAMPAVLVEVQFISNPDEEKKMGSDDYAARAAEGLLRGLEELFRALPAPAGPSAQ